MMSVVRQDYLWCLAKSFVSAVVVMVRIVYVQVFTVGLKKWLGVSLMRRPRLTACFATLLHLVGHSISAL